MIQRVDLHTHTNASDGTDTPSELVENARKAGLAAVAITDHDTLSGLAEGEEAAQRMGGIEFVRGVEVSTGTDQGEMHIVGLWVPKDCEPLENALAVMRSKRGERNQRILEKLATLGIHLDMDDVLHEAGGESVGRPHIARALITKGYVKTITEAFDKYLGATGKAYLAKEVMEPEEAVRVMSGIGCSVFIAHPMLKPYPPGWIDEFVKRLLPYGLCGIEAWHSEHTEADSRAVISLARRFHLCVSGGSDYHGKNKPRISLGTGYGSLFVTSDAFALLKEWRAEQGLPC